ncbi:MAG: hypothetical protein ACE361_07365 [Aureliella sp.]
MVPFFWASPDLDLHERSVSLAVKLKACHAGCCDNAKLPRELLANRSNFQMQQIAIEIATKIISGTGCVNGGSDQTSLAPKYWN